MVIAVIATRVKYISKRFSIKYKKWLDRDNSIGKIFYKFKLLLVYIQLSI